MPSLPAAPALIKTSPLSGVYRRFPVQLTQVQGWSVAEHFGNPEAESQCLLQNSVLVDWSHLGKISFSGKQAALVAEQIQAGAGAIAPLTSFPSPDRVVLRLTANDYLWLFTPSLEEELIPQISSSPVTVINQTGALGCFALAGPRRDEVLERSTAMNLRRDRVMPGAVIQTTVHTIRCTLYRTEALDVLLHPRSLSESLFDALLDVGINVGLRPTGLRVLPTSTMF